MIHFEIK